MSARKRIWQMKFFSVMLVVGAVMVGLVAAPAARAADEKLRQDLNKAVSEAKSSLVEALARVIRDEAAQEQFVAQLARIVEKREARLTGRIAELEKSLAEKDRRIADLEKKVAELAKGPKVAEKPVVKKVVKPVEVERPKQQGSPFLGISHVIHKDGAAVTFVHPRSPAARAGIQAKDIITAVSGKKVTSDSIAGTIRSHAVGETVKITLLRDGKQQEVEAGLVDREKFLAAEMASPAEREAEPVFLGIWVEELPSGVVVDVVDEGYTGHVAGLKKGDRITHVNGTEVKSNEQLAAALKKINAGEEFTLTTAREGEVVDIVLIGSAGKGGAKLLSRTPKKAAGADKPEEKPVKEKPAAKEKRPAFLGVSVADDDGVVVDGVLPDTAAAKAGIRAGDIVKKVNGKDVASSAQLAELVGEHAAGDKIRVVVERDKKTLELEVVLGTRDEETAAEEKGPPKPPRKKGVLGITAQEFDDGTVVVKELTPGGPAEQAGLKPDDAILKVDDRVIKNFDDLAAALNDKLAGDEIHVRIKRGDQELDMKFKLGEPPEELEE